MKKTILLVFTTMCIVCTLSFPQYAFSQKNEASKLRPTWATETYHKDLNNSYLEVVVIKGENNLTTMRQLAQGEIERRRHSAVGVKDEIWMKAPPIAEYLDDDGVVYFLYQTLKNPNYTPESISISDKYPFSARVFVPGWAQFHKGQTGKGAFFITSEVIFIGSIIATQSLKSYYKAQIGSTHNSALKSQFATNANICNIAGYVAIAGAVGLYIGNIIDGCVSLGRPTVFIDNNGKISELSLMPYATPVSTGLALNLKF